MQKTLLAAVVPLVAGLLVAGCGSSDNNSSSATTAPKPASKPKPKSASSSSSASSGGASSNLKLSADPSGALKFNKKKLAAKAGAVTITMSNPSTLPHAIAVEGNGVDKDGETAMQGGTSTVSVDLKPGKYEFYCPVDSHKQAGMEGTLTVT
jgi:plastocyanin